MDGQANTGYNSALIAALRGSSPAPQQMGGISFFDPSAGAQGGMQASPINFTPSSRQAAFNPQTFSASSANPKGAFAGGGTGNFAVPGFVFDEYTGTYSKEPANKSLALFSKFWAPKQSKNYTFAEALAEYSKPNSIADPWTLSPIDGA